MCQRPTTQWSLSAAAIDITDDNFCTTCRSACTACNNPTPQLVVQVHRSETALLTLSRKEFIHLVKVFFWVDSLSSWSFLIRTCSKPCCFLAAIAASVLRYASHAHFLICAGLFSTVPAPRNFRMFSVTSFKNQYDPECSKEITAICFFTFKKKKAVSRKLHAVRSLLSPTFR